MSTSIFSIGVSALNAAQVGLATTEHNIANANTPGFNRQQVVIAARPAQSTGAGFLGQGVDAVSVKRVYSEFLGRQVLNEQGQSAQLNTYYAQIQQIDNMLADPNSGLSPAIQQFFSAVNNVSTNPESVPARQSLISGANFLTSRFQSLNQRMADMNNSVNSQIGYSVTQINSYAKQISSLNQNIVLAQSANGQPPNDMLDQRDQLIAQLNKEIKATVVKQTDGSFNVFVADGNRRAGFQHDYTNVCH
jgi:flagellar hook-associated protein 1 FlgK